MKTPLQQLKEILEVKRDECSEKLSKLSPFDMFSSLDGQITSINFAIKEIESLLPIERECIITAVNEISKKDVNMANNALTAYSRIKGQLFVHDDKIGEQYFNTTYNENN